MNLVATSWWDTDWLNNWEVPFGKWIEEAIEWLNVKFDTVFSVVEWPFENLLDLVVDKILLEIPWPLLVLAVILIGIGVRNTLVGFGAGGALLLCGILGPDYWTFTVQTIGIILVAVTISVIIGLPYGIVCARSDRVWGLTRPVLDGMQIIHPFTYLIPIIFFFGTGPVGGTIATMIFAVPPMIRLTNLGIRQVPEDVVEAARAYGASEQRVLTDVQLPLARPAIMTGLNQTLLLSLSMVGIIAVIAGGGLGQLVLRGINTNNDALGASSGLALYLVGVMLDRLSQPDPSDERSLARRLFAALRGETRVPPVPDGAPTEEAVEEPTPAAEPLTGRDRVGALLGLVGGALATVSVVLPWSIDAGLLSSHMREVDRDLPGSHLGWEASGGSWYAMAVAAAGIVIIAGSVAALVRHRRRWTDWLSVPLGQIALGAGIVLAMVTYLIAQPAPFTEHHSDGIGVYLALVGGIVTLVGGVWTLDRSASQARYSSVNLGAVVVTALAGLIIVGASVSSWVNDQRPDRLPPEAQAEVERLRNDPSAEAASLIAQVIGENRGEPASYTGFDDNGPLFGPGVLVTGLVALAAAAAAALRPRLVALTDAVALGVGAAALILGFGWTFSSLRVAENGIFSGVATLFVILGGALLVSSTIRRMQQRWTDEREAADAWTADDDARLAAAVEAEAASTVG